MTAPTPDVTFSVLDVTPERYAVSPILEAHIGISSTGDESIHAIALRCQIRIQPLRRAYTDEEAAGLLDLFGPRERWSATQQAFPWLHTTSMVPGFTGATRSTLSLQCTYDVEVAASKYFHALRDGTIPLQFLFSGTIFGAGERGLRVRHVSWDCEDSYDMPVAVWRDLIAQHYPNSGWLRLSHDSIATLSEFKSRSGLLDLDDAISALVAGATQKTACTNGSSGERR
ncbi:DUF6084 family protein [Candidatus Mycolicibacterium alkanivorans]|uniref:DUF6084 family protein n=1 Tax=Candidatus Mycolicibacterium alkanivorans TaxID=2954114 RepID=A0ABS9YZL8_9MYCO|nr:DUF6084 family protein [Candidatus Mycolicibacterium alkanivorans]MCI4676679.1 DUF6084 family protein [Candidatus Mycolicibacterium alkanivorans]